MCFAWNPRKGLPFPGGETSIRRERPWDQTGDLRYEGFLAHRNPEENENEPEIPRTLNRQFAPIGAEAGHPQNDDTCRRRQIVLSFLELEQEG